LGQDRESVATGYPTEGAENLRSYNDLSVGLDRGGVDYGCHADEPYGCRGDGPCDDESHDWGDEPAAERGTPDARLSADLSCACVRHLGSSSAIS
jgi:hypothetical protein